MITIDGSYGEGGGQIVRTALALSLVTSRPFRIANIRAGRRKPGLMRQHLTALNAAAEIGAAEVSGDTIGSPAFTFAPQTIRAGRFHYAIGSAGSGTLVLQTILPALVIAGAPSEIILEGGTHNPFAPPFDFLEQAFLPLVARMGPQIETVLEKPGFFPAGGGRFRVRITPVQRLAAMQLTERGALRRQTARAAVSNLPLSIAHRELKVVGRELGWPPENLEAVTVENAQGPGNVLTIAIESETLTEVFTGFGQRGVSAEKVAARAVSQVRAYLARDVPVGRHLADQLLVPLAMAGGGQYRTLPPSRHTRTNIDIIRHFLDVAIATREEENGIWEISIG